MQVRHKSVLVKTVNKPTTPTTILPEVDYYEVAFTSPDITDVPIGSHIYFRAQEGKVTFEGQEYLVVTDENVKVVL